MGHRTHSAVGWGFGITCGVALAIILVIAAILAVVILGCGGVGALFIASDVPVKSRIGEPSPSPTVMPRQPTTEPPRPKMRVERVDREATPQEFHVFIWSDNPTNEEMEMGLEKIAADADRKVFFYPAHLRLEDEPFAIWLIRDYEYQRLR